jgi:hypothetical protein
LRKSKSGDPILQLVKRGVSLRPLRIELSGLGNRAAEGTKTMLTGTNPIAVSEITSPQPIVPSATTLPISPTFDCEAPPNLLIVIRNAAMKGFTQ